MARSRLPGDQGPVRRSIGVRSHHARGGHHANCGSAPDATTSRSPRMTPSARWTLRLHRLRRMRRGCPNGSAMLFVAAKLAHLHNLPQGQAERLHRTQAMVGAMDAAGFGNCSNHYECEPRAPRTSSAM